MLHKAHSSTPKPKPIFYVGKKLVIIYKYTFCGIIKLMYFAGNLRCELASLPWLLPLLPLKQSEQPSATPPLQLPARSQCKVFKTSDYS